MSFHYGDVLRAYWNGDVTDDDVAFHMEVVSSQGAHYDLLLEGHQRGTELINRAKRYIRDNFDAVSFETIHIKMPTPELIAKAERLSEAGCSSSTLYDLFK